jgi:putative DNA primase/helicase
MISAEREIHDMKAAILIGTGSVTIDDVVTVVTSCKLKSQPYEGRGKALQKRAPNGVNFDWPTIIAKSNDTVMKIRSLKDEEKEKLCKVESVPGKTLSPRVRELFTTHNGHAALAHMINETHGTASPDMGDIRYDFERKSWMIWEGKVWAEDPEGIHVVGKIESILFNLVKDLADSKDTELIKTILGVQCAQGIKSAMVLLQPMLVVETKVFDADSHLINLQNGTYDVKAGVMHPHKKTDFITKMATIDYDPNAKAPDWEAHMQMVVPDADTRKAFQIYMGHSLVAGTEENAALFAFGEGKNGKSVTFGAIDGILGDYAIGAAPTTFTEKYNDDGPRPDLARMKGARLVTVPEGKQGRKLDEGVLKNLTGGSDKVTARFLYGRDFTFEPTAKLVFHTNHLPKVEGQDPGVWRRIFPVPFTVTVPEERRIKGYDKILVAMEGPGIFNWLVKGYQLYCENGGLFKSKLIVDETARYKDKEDLLGDFFEQYVVTGQTSDKIKRSDLFDSYMTWTNFGNGNGKPFSKSKFNVLVEGKLGSPIKGGDGVWMWSKVKKK